jgi:CheY-like chemotaxis protein
MNDMEKTRPKKRTTGSRPKVPPMDESPLVLIVDDYADAREMFAAYMTKRAGFRVIEANDGHAALKQAMAQIPDVIVMDLSLPGMDGWEATRRLKNDARTKHIPVLALTGHALVGGPERQRAIEAGCDAFLPKPCLPMDLVAEIQRLLAEAAEKGPGHGQNK